jgi:hypothetical protein
MILEEQLRELARHLEGPQEPITVDEVVARVPSTSVDHEGARLEESVDDLISMESAPSYLDGLGTRGRRAADEQSTSPDSAGRRPSLIVVTAAAGLLLLVAASLLLTGNDDAEPDITASIDPTVAPATPPGEAELVAREFLDAWATFDADQAMGYLTDRALTELWGGADALRLEVAMLEALGTRVTVTGCGQVGEPVEGMRLLCSPEYSSATRIQGVGPRLDISWDLTVRDGLIARAERGGQFDRLSERIWELWEPFSRWMEAAHPLDIPLMFDGLGWRLDEESIRLWEQRTREFSSSDAGRISRGVGLLGLPPEGAVPSTPETGELVVRMYSHASRGGDFWLFVYADGRVIWSDYTGATPTPAEAEMSGSVGFLERRLTPEGVDLLLDEVLSTGLFDPDQPISDRGPTIEAFNGDQLVGASRIPGGGLFRQLREFESWLAPEAWEDSEARFYVPSRYVACLTSQELPGSADPSRLLSLLPVPAADVLADAPHLAVKRSLVTGKPEDAAWMPGEANASEPPDHCFELMSDEARTVVDSLEVAGGVPGGVGASVFGYRLEIPGPSPTRVDVAFIPYLPHGEVECACYG